MYTTLASLPSHVFPLAPGDRIYFSGDLGAGKTTFIRELISAHFGEKIDVTSPTYTYYQQYGNIYHFDLYRITDPDDLMRIGAMEIFDDPETICLIEWPERLADTIEPTKLVTLTGEGE
jgi:tRNA threonylcarbamoyladenosine biosynthesis protein TsaE